MSLIQVGTFLATIDFEEDKSMTDSPIPARKSTVMVVDDEPDLVELVRIALELKGFNVRCAYSGKHLFACLEALKPDLILLDIMMPQMDGLEVLTRLKGDPDTASIPVILLTVKGEPEDVIKGYERGADVYITKPFTSTEVLEAINLVLGGDQDPSVESP